MIVVTKMHYGELAIDFEHKFFHPSTGATGAGHCG
jgi:hypothetical protein